MMSIEKLAKHFEEAEFTALSRHTRIMFLRIDDTRATRFNGYEKQEVDFEGLMEGFKKQYDSSSVGKVMGEMFFDYTPEYLCLWYPDGENRIIYFSRLPQIKVSAVSH
jgi:hypothetical protein